MDFVVLPPEDPSVDPGSSWPPNHRYSEAGFRATIRRFAGRLGRRALESAFTLYHCLQDPDTPAWARTVIVAALAYLILPADAVPDLLPGAGLADDLGAISAALVTISTHVKPEHRNRARSQVATLVPAR